MGWSRFRATGLTHHYAPLSFKGYTLFTPTRGEATFLLDMQGRIVHRWRHTSIHGWYGRLQPNGTLLVGGVDRSLPPPHFEERTAPTFEQQIRRLGGAYTNLMELDWDGNVLWSYQNPAIHHDFVRLENGNTLIPNWIELPEDVARGVRGGTRERPPSRLIADDILEIDPAGNEVSRIHLWQLLDPVADPICPLEYRREWTHLNCINLTADGGLVFSCREISRVGIIDPSREKISWKFGAPDVINHQHHPTVLPNGNIQIFDNGMHRHGAPRSRVIEVNPKDNKIVWQYAAEPEASFFSSHISGAERQPNGNTLICEGGPGRIFEVTPGGEVVWEWINPVTSQGGRNNVFRAHRYAPDFPGLADKDLDPDRHRDLNRLYGLIEGA